MLQQNPVATAAQNAMIEQLRHIDIPTVPPTLDNGEDIEFVDIGGGPKKRKLARECSDYK
jgi:hypothetical protein